MNICQILTLDWPFQNTTEEKVTSCRQQKFARQTFPLIVYRAGITHPIKHLELQFYSQTTASELAVKTEISLLNGNYPAPHNVFSRAHCY